MRAPSITPTKARRFSSARKGAKDWSKLIIPGRWPNAGWSCGIAVFRDRGLDAVAHVLNLVGWDDAFEHAPAV